eukprot:gb/GEZN01002698.1/.p1 GENE.gb/GEZN01002698.1/~~gb/GEZN01002698.1/.p1  ORF type:complete len:613 (+),score=88.02 gb/GEZN01002698.1/:66-1904(+)
MLESTCLRGSRDEHLQPEYLSMGVEDAALQKKRCAGYWRLKMIVAAIFLTSMTGMLVGLFLGSPTSDSVMEPEENATPRRQELLPWATQIDVPMPEIPADFRQELEKMADNRELDRSTKELDRNSIGELDRNTIGELDRNSVGQLDRSIIMELDRSAIVLPDALETVLESVPSSVSEAALSSFRDARDKYDGSDAKKAKSEFTNDGSNIPADKRGKDYYKTKSEGKDKGKAFFGVVTGAPNRTFTIPFTTSTTSITSTTSTTKAPTEGGGGGSNGTEGGLIQNNTSPLPTASVVPIAASSSPVPAPSASAPLPPIDFPTACAAAFPGVSYPVCQTDASNKLMFHAGPQCSPTGIRGVCNLFEIDTAPSTSNANVVWPDLEFVGEAFNIKTNLFLVSLSFPKLAKVGNFLQILSNPLLVSVSFPVLLKVGNYLAVFNNVNLPTIDFSSLQEAGDMLEFSSNTKMSTLQLGALATVKHSLTLQGLNLTTASFPSLKNVTRELKIKDNPSLKLVNCPVLTRVGSSIEITGNGALTTILLPALAAINTIVAGTSFDIPATTNLVTCTIGTTAQCRQITTTCCRGPSTCNVAPVCNIDTDICTAVYPADIICPSTPG